MYKISAVNKFSYISEISDNVPSVGTSYGSLYYQSMVIF